MIQKIASIKQSLHRFAFLYLLGFFLAGSPVQAANILIVSAVAYPNVDVVLTADLGGANTLTITHSIPASLAGFTQIYDANIDVGLTGAQMNQYLAFLNAAPNNSLLLVGENAFFSARNNAIKQFITLAGGGTIGSVSTSFATESVATQFRTPNSVASVAWQACGSVTTPGTGTFATASAGGGGCSLFFGLGALANAPTGALMVVNDINFVLGAVSANEVAFRQNMEHFLAAPVAAQQRSVAVPTLSEWMQILLAVLLLLLGLRQSRQR